MKNKKGNTSLHESLVNQKYDVAIKLLEVAKKVTLTGRTLEAIASMHIDDANEVVTMDNVLLQLINVDGDTPFSLAVRVGRLEGFERLIKYVENAKNILKNSKVVS